MFVSINKCISILPFLKRSQSLFLQENLSEEYISLPTMFCLIVCLGSWLSIEWISHTPARASNPVRDWVRVKAEIEMIPPVTMIFFLN